MKYIIVQNTIAPYRISLFNELWKQGLNIEVLYMCDLEKERSWIIDYDSIKYPYYVDKGFYRQIKGFQFHWNPKIIKRLMHERNCIIILGASWNYIDIVVSCVLKRLHYIKSDIIFWSEANYLTNGARKRNKLRDWLRSFVYGSGNGVFIVPGEMAIRTLKLWKVKVTHCLLLPNVIQEENFNSNDRKIQVNRLPEFIFPTRLNERVKGVINFFNSIGSDNVRKAIFHILGDGQDKEMINDFIIKNHFENNILLEGFCSMDKVAAFYETCDALLLPSFSDPSPLSVVEAINNGLPLLISNRCGNHFEALIEGKNGFSFNPDSSNDVREAYEKFLKMRDSWIEMGHISKKIFENKFKQSVVLSSFIKSLNQLYL